MDNSLNGKRVELIEMSDPFTKLKAGDMGTIQFIDDIGQIHVRWDTGSGLALIPGVDQYRILVFCQDDGCEK